MYDGASRLTSIEHKDAIGSTILKLDYQYLDNDLVSVITESDINGWAASPAVHDLAEGGKGKR